MIYFKRKTGADILVLANGIEVPNIIITTKEIIVDIVPKEFTIVWAFYASPTAYLNGSNPLHDQPLRINEFHFVFDENSTPNFQTALNMCDWANGGDFSQVGGNQVLAYFGNMDDPTTMHTDKISDNWQGMIYNG